ncbi:hypothetical protein LTR85_011251 [Meristemomyces frigidus]|nr:hypothetical protein LTR85_011251 [Meristemomyces frigidus]
MPRRKASDKDPARLSRSRAGCLTCRERRIRCDEKRPQCGHCHRKGLECRRGVQLKWQAEYADLGLAFGRSGVWKKHGRKGEVAGCTTADSCFVSYPEIRHHSFLDGLLDVEDVPDAFVKELENGDVNSYDGESPISPVSSKPMSWPPTWLETAADGAFLAAPARHHQHGPQAALSLFSNLGQHHAGTLLQYFVRQVCPLTTMSAPEASPFLHIVMPFLTTSPGLAMDAVLALSARHLAKSERSWQLVATNFECKALGSLRARLNRVGVDGASSSPDVSLAMMIFCLLEIINASDSKWVVHLKGARSLVRAMSASTTCSLASDELTAFTNKFFAFQDVIGRTACGEEPIFGSEYWHADDNTVNAWLGCSPALVSIVCSITELGREKPNLQSLDLEQRSALLEHRLDTLQQVVPHHDEGYLRRCANVKHVAAQVYIHCALHGSGPRTALVKGLVSTIIQHLRAFIKAGKGAGLLWPLFVAAVELDPLDDCYTIDAPNGNNVVHGRSFILGALEHLAHTSLANTVKARQVIMQVWSARDKASDEAVDPIHFSDWDRFVAPVSHSISLA